MASASFWRNLKVKFEELSRLEFSMVPNPADNRRLRAQGEYPIGGRHEVGCWTVNDGFSLDFKAAFDEIATLAGSMIGPRAAAKPLDVWVHSLFEFLCDTEENREDRGHLAVGEKQRGGIIRDLCVASATFCSNLAKEAVELRSAGSRARGRSDALTKQVARRMPPNGDIDVILREIAKSQPKSQAEVFRALDKRVRPPRAKPFAAAGGWVTGFRRDEKAARSWLSKNWSRLMLPRFTNGPKR